MAIDRLYEGDRLAIALRDARARTLALYSHLDVASLEVPCIPILNPPLWELAHIAWFQEYWCLRYSRRQAAATRRPLLPGADALFDSRTVPHDSRWHLPYPPATKLFGYLATTLEATMEALSTTPEDERYFFGLVLLHEDMHGEALVMTLQTLGLAPPPLGAAAPGPSTRLACEDVAFTGGEFVQGAPRDAAPFVFDNEKWAHLRQVAPFRMASRTVTQGEFLAFVEDGGYARAELWSREGQAWLNESGRRAPRGWRREDGTWARRRFDAWTAVEPDAPMLHVTLHEAMAYCRWAGRRLPTETEWEFAARNGGDDTRYPWGEEPPSADQALDLRRLGPWLGAEDARPAPTGLRQMMGGVWEWTASPFLPYPGFTVDPYAEYSEPWFGSHYVLRGGSFATRGRLVHNRFRNFYLPGRDDVFAGFRTCAVEST